MFQLLIQLPLFELNGMVELSGFPTQWVILVELKADVDLFTYSVEHRLKFGVTFDLNYGQS
jgi:hypothetical protein